MNHSPEAFDMLAFRYIADELSATERDDFESQLATNQAAREAVARMVEYSAAIRFAVASPVREPAVVVLPERKKQLNTYAAVTVLVGSSLALLLAAALFFSPIDDWDGGAESQLSSDDNQVSELALAWAETRSQVRSVHELAGDDEWTAELPEGLADIDDSEDEAHFQAPGWMLAAVAGLTDDTARPREVVE